MTPQESKAIKKYAVIGLTLKAENAKLHEQLTAAKKAAAVWKQRYNALQEKYEELKRKSQPYLSALKAAPEKVRAFISGILAQTRDEKEHKPPHHGGRNIEI